MAYHGPAYGLSAEVKQKLAAKYDPALEREVRSWIQRETGQNVSGDFHTGLKDGVLLCNLMNRLSPGSVKKINTGRMPFLQMENIAAFLAAAKAAGMADHDLFQTVDLYEAKNMTQVVLTLAAISRHFGRGVSAAPPDQTDPFAGSSSSSSSTPSYSAPAPTRSAPPQQSSGSGGGAFPFGTKFNPHTGEAIPKFDPFTGKQNW
eukprot:CAMPEP_0174260498 /NCGR_PEP_ID=MMETSP0439-20130205/9766_1 /TAXON_ID=0 /ORGANISM="Stereomyxa ramosa, Strain Chinc5" /LENGTH=203 /DNA_ID=CAMNT_0015344751 /DNA_START=1 /DNA_END=612 /DNA_ORIENTATION=+